MECGRKLSIFCYVKKSSKLLVFLFLLRHFHTPECFYIKTAVFELVQQIYHATEIDNVANAVSACADQP